MNNDQPMSKEDYAQILRGLEAAHEERIQQYKAEFRKIFDAAEATIEILETGDLKAVEDNLRYIKLKAMALG